MNSTALERGLPITDPLFYGDEALCPDSLIEEIFKPADGCGELIPLLRERISIMRQVGKIFIQKIPGQCYMGLLSSVVTPRQNNEGSTLLLLNSIVQEFPAFRDESTYEGKKVVFWKRAQILIAETWAAFHPTNSSDPHPLLPDGVDALTMFADYRVPHILQSLGILSYSSELKETLNARPMLPYGSKPECSIRAGSIIAVEELKVQMEEQSAHKQREGPRFNSVLIDFFLWDLAKSVESEENATGSTLDILPCHRTRSIFY